MCIVSFSKKPKYSSKVKVDKFNGNPNWGYVEITSKCSHGCSWCFGGFNENKTSEMELWEFQNILGKLKKIGITQLTISGGEPTEHSDFLEMIEAATEEDFIVHLCSHGDWSKNWAIELAKLGVKQIQFNYQGSKRHDKVHKALGSYLKQVQAIKQTNASGIETVATVTVGAYNLKDVPEIFKELSDLGTERLRVWETTGRGNAWRKDKEAVDIFQYCQDTAKELGFIYTQSYDPEFKAESFVDCPASSKMYMYINSDSELRFCSAKDSYIDSFKTSDVDTILQNYNNFMNKSIKHKCLARE